MPFTVPMDQAQAMYTDYTFICPLTPSEQKAAFHVKDKQDHDLCLKIIAPNYSIDRLDREILALQSIQHPNIVRLIEYTRSSKTGQQKHCIIEEFIEGTDLGENIRPGQPWSRQDTSDFFAALFDGIAMLNKLNIVHRDLKPNNIRVRPNGSPVIIDFGLARHLDLPSLTNTPDGAAIGTPQYFSPEQCRGTKHDIDHRTDLFASGCLLYQVLIGKHPFWQGGMTYSQLHDAICESTDYLREPNFLTLPEQWQILVGRLLNKERVDRPANATHAKAIILNIGGI